jgi:hypothetical protein
VNGFGGYGTSKKKAKSKAPHVKPTCGPRKFVSGFFVRATRPFSKSTRSKEPTLSSNQPLIECHAPALANFREPCRSLGRFARHDLPKHTQAPRVRLPFFVLADCILQIQPNHHCSRSTLRSGLHLWLDRRYTKRKNHHPPPQPMLPRQEQPQAAFQVQRTLLRRTICSKNATGTMLQSRYSA